MNEKITDVLNILDKEDNPVITVKIQIENKGYKLWKLMSAKLKCKKMDI